MLIALAPIAALVAVAQPLEETKLTLRNMQPDRYVLMLRGELKGLVPGIASMKVNDDESITVRGTSKALEEIKNVTRFMDVAPRTVAIQARVLRLDPSTPDAEPKVVIDARIVTKNGVPAQLSIGNGEVWTLGLTPHTNGDGSFTVSGTVERKRELASGKRQEQWVKFTRRVKPDTPRRINLLADSRQIVKPEPTLDEFPKTPYFAIEFTASGVDEPTPQVVQSGWTVR